MASISLKQQVVSSLPLFEAVGEPYYAPRLEFTNPRAFKRDITGIWPNVADEHFDELIRIDLWSKSKSSKSGRRWIPVQSLALIAAFAEGLRARNQARLRLTLFSPEDVNQILRPTSTRLPAHDLVREVRDLVRFYYLNGFPDLMVKLGVELVPSISVCLELFKRLRAEINAGHQYSSTMLPLSTLIEDPVCNTDLAERLANVKNILVNQLYQDDALSKDPSKVRKAQEKAETASTIFMFELVSNIYQHAYFSLSPRSSNRGFAGAQIAHYPLAEMAETRMRTFATLKGKAELAGSDHSQLSSAVRYLALSVCDFGLGLPQRVRTDLESKLAELAIEREEHLASNLKLVANIDKVAGAIKEQLKKSDSELIIWASTTPYTCKLDFSDPRDQMATEMSEGLDSVVTHFLDAAPREEHHRSKQYDVSVEFIENDQVIRRILHPAGFGLGYCLLFAAKNFGSLTITSSGVEVTFNAKKEAFRLSQDGKLDLTYGFERLSKDPSSLFDIKVSSNRLLPPGNARGSTKSQFPGTLVHLDIPVLFRWADCEPSFIAQEEKGFHALYEMLFKAE